MLIRDLEQKTGLDRATIRYYEKEGFLKPVRQENGYRTHSEDDLETLLKIKLLRQLGLSLEKIRQVQQGREDFSAALGEQIRILEDQIQAKNRAKDVCRQMRDAGVSYDRLNAAYYLELLNKPAQTAPPARPEFHERIQREYHPIRRFAARFIDYAILSCWVRFLLIVVLRIRPFGSFLSLVISYAVFFLVAAANALWLHLFGSTPGKWVMGLRVESCNGGNLSYFDALQRERDVLRFGLGWGIPVWELWRLYQSYKQYRDEPDLNWDEACEYIYEDWSVKQKTALTGFVCIILALSFSFAQDVTKPKYRGTDLTIAQFSANYNFYLDMMSKDTSSQNRLRPDGTFADSPGTAVIYVCAEPENKNACFQYETENGYIRTISYENSWSNIFMFNPMNGKCSLAAFSVLMAQNGSTLSDLREFEEIWEEQCRLPEGTITWENIEIRWKIHAVNCQNLDGDYRAIDDTVKSSLHLEFEMVINSFTK
ncbi:MAG: MerR family transcriptional regulator [Clostridiales bacterium]|nr:MerR family transcriptional regulator [Clostridiales bacterium]